MAKKQLSQHYHRHSLYSESFHLIVTLTSTPIYLLFNSHSTPIPIWVEKGIKRGEKGG